MRAWMTATLSLVLALNTLGLAASADSTPTTLLFFAGFGPPCTVPAPNACPDVAAAPSGDTVAISGAGSLTTMPKSASGSGTFVHRDAAGNVRASGGWTVNRLISFHFYGCGVDASGNPLPAFLCGGQALLAVHLVASSGFETDGILTVDCEIGPKIPGGAHPGGAVEGVTLLVPGIANFNKSVSGFTVYVAP